MDYGWVKLHRKMRDNPLLRRPAYRAVWIELLFEAEHGMIRETGKWRKKTANELKQIIWKGQTIRLQPGQLTVGAKQLSEWSGVPRGTVERIIKKLKSEEMIEEQTSNRFSLITVKKWKDYQINEEQNEEQVRNKRGTSEDTLRMKECKNDKNVNKPLASGDAGEIKKSSSKRNKSDPMNRQEFMDYMKQSKRRSLHIIADWADTLKPSFTTWGQWDVFMRRNLRPAADLESFSQQQIIRAYGEIMTDSKDGEKFKPTLETIIKYLTK